MNLSQEKLIGPLLILCIYFLFAGSRFSDGEIAAGVFRSLHAIDLFFPVLTYICVRNRMVIKQSIPGSVIALSWLWLAYVGTLAHLGHFISGLAFEGEPLLVSMLFAIKEIEFFVMMCFGAIAAMSAPRFIRRVLWIALALLALWIPVDMQEPSGYYLLGLPFEKGAIQVGLVYGMTSLFVVYLLLTEPPRKFTRRLFGFVVLISLVAGMLLSLSRTAVLGFGVSIGLLCLIFPLRMGLSMSLVAAVTASLGSLLAPDELWRVFDLVFGRWSDVSEHAGYRYDKWLELLGYLISRPSLLFFGAGFDSPNQLVLGRELGHILAVDNAYVRKLFEVGILGAASYFVLIASIFLNLLKERTTRAGTALITFFLASGLTAETTQISQSAGLFFLLTGVIFGLSRSNNTEISKCAKLLAATNAPSLVVPRAS